MKIESLRARLVLAAAVWVVLATVLGGWALSNTFRNTAADTFDARLASLVAMLIGAVDVDATGALELQRDLGDARFDSIYSGWYWVVADSGGPRLRSRSLWDMDLAIERAPPAAQPTFTDQQDAAGRMLRVASQTVTVHGRDRPLTVVVSADAAALAAEIRRFDLLLMTALALLACGLIAAVLVQVHYGLRPLVRVTRQVEQVRTGHSAHLRRPGTRELDLLVEEVNSLIDHNQRLIERTRANVADLAHSLKTPLAVLKTELTAQQPDHAAVHAQLARMERMISRRLSVAAVAGPGRMSGTPVAPTIDELTRGLGRVYADRALTFVNEVPADVRVRIEREDLEEIAGSLLDNACKFACRTVRVAIDRGVDADRLLLRVEDDGEGMSAEQAALAVDRGQRFDSNAPGSGLGLAIVADIAELYGGKLMLTRTGTGGLRAEVDLPVAR